MATEGTFVERIGVLRTMVGSGEVVGYVEYDQVYAHRQHEELGWKHPHGGQARYLSTALFAGSYAFMQMLADRALDTDGVVTGMIEAVELLAAESRILAPIEVGVLRDSVHPWVENDGMTVFDRPPAVPRLSDIELDRIHDMVSDLTQPDVTTPRKRKHHGPKL